MILLLTLIQLSLIHSLSFGGEQIELDFIGNVYINGDIGLRKVDEDGNSKVYSSEFLSPFAFVDVSNNQKVLAYNHDYNQLIVLDADLIEIYRLDLFDIGLKNPILAVQDKDMIWTFDLVEHKFRKLKANSQIVFEGRILPVNGINENSQLVSYNEKIYLSSANGIYIFDFYSNLSSKLDLFDCRSFALEDDYIYYLTSSGVLQRFHLEEKSTEEIITDKELRDIAIQDGKIYLCFRNKVKVFKLNQ